MLFGMISAFAAIAVFAAEWRQSVTGVELDVRGLHITSLEDIRAAIALTDSSNLASLDLLGVRRDIMSNPFIRDVELMRNPPKTLVVNVTERTPIAMLINVQSKDWLVDQDGYVLPASSAPSMYDLPVITGVGKLRDLNPGVRITSSDVRRALQALRTARATDNDMLNVFSEINVSNKRDMILYTMEAGVPIIFGPASQVENKLRAFKAFWENVAMKYDPTSLEYVDLRWKEQVVTRWRSSKHAPVVSVSPDTLVVDTLLTIH